MHEFEKVALAFSRGPVGSPGRRAVAAEIGRHDVEQDADFRVYQTGTDAVFDLIQRA